MSIIKFYKIRTFRTQTKSIKYCVEFKNAFYSYHPIIETFSPKSEVFSPTGGKQIGRILELNLIFLLNFTIAISFAKPFLNRECVITRFIWNVFAFVIASSKVLVKTIAAEFGGIFLKQWAVDVQIFF